MIAKHTLKVIPAKEFHEMTSVELREHLTKFQNEKMKIEGKNKSPMAAPLSHPSGEARQNRKSIARIKTILKQRGE
jgi:ribosomal protein L29